MRGEGVPRLPLNTMKQDTAISELMTSVIVHRRTGNVSLGFNELSCLVLMVVGGDIALVKTWIPFADKALWGQFCNKNRFDLIPCSKQNIVKKISVS